MQRVRAGLIWVALGVALTVPVAIAATSPLLEWREPAYIAAGFAGIVGLGLLLIQPLLAGYDLPGLSIAGSRTVHRWLGSTLVAVVVVHIIGLWITSPPDVIDALLFASPTPFSMWGVIAMWAVFLSAGLALSRRRLSLGPRVWRSVHGLLGAVIVIGTVVHAVLIDGTMGTVSKVLLCAAVIVVTAKVLFEKRIWKLGK